MAVVLALMVIGGDFWPPLLGFQQLNPLSSPNFYLSFFAYVIVLYMLVWIPVSKMKEGGLPATHFEH